MHVRADGPNLGSVGQSDIGVIVGQDGAPVESVALLHPLGSGNTQIPGSGPTGSPNKMA